VGWFLVEAARERPYPVDVQGICAPILERWRHAPAARLALFDVGH
jgi:hypothetical protein